MEGRSVADTNEDLISVVVPVYNVEKYLETCVNSIRNQTIIICMEDNMKVLYIAFACDPNKGSEAQCGWAWPMNMKDNAEVFVLTRTENKESIESYIKNKNIVGVTPLYFDIPNCLNFYYKFGKLYHVYYVMWQMMSYKYIKDIVNKYSIDVVHQITLGDFRVINRAWKLPVRFFWGPVGGAQLTPESLIAYAKQDRKSEYIRSLINLIISKLPSYRRALNRIDYIFAANPETQSFLASKIKDTSRCVLLTENGVTNDQVNSVLPKKRTDKVTLMWAGRMVNRKGLSFLLDALEIMETEKDYKLILVGDGPEKKKLQRIVEDKGLSDVVEFTGKVDYHQMRLLYCESDMFVFPSIRETTGTVLFEAMINSLPVLSFNQNGASMLIDDKCGVLIDVNNLLPVVLKDFSDALKRMIENRDLLVELGTNAYAKIVREYTWERKCRYFYYNYLAKEQDAREC